MLVADLSPHHRELAVALLDLSDLGLDPVSLLACYDPQVVYLPLVAAGVVSIPGSGEPRVTLTDLGRRWAARWRTAAEPSS